VEAKNIAVLDTDFISKLYTTKNNKKAPLLGKIMELPFQFHCHRQTLIELECKETQRQCSKWLIDQNKEQKLEIISDLDLINRMRAKLNSDKMDTALNMYRMFLQESCSLFSSNLYNLHYIELDSVEPSAKEPVISEAIRHGDESVGNKNNLGEIKAITMIYLFMWLDSVPVFQFLSDDTTARRMLIQDERFSAHMNCISALGSFYVLFKKGLLDRETAKEFFDSWMELHASTNQTKFRIRNSNKGRQLEKIEGYSLFEGIFSGALEMGRDGFLQYC
jgi:hypothetical protein